MPFGYKINIPFIGELTKIAVSESDSESVSLANKEVSLFVVVVAVPPSRTEIISVFAKLEALELFELALTIIVPVTACDVEEPVKVTV